MSETLDWGELRVHREDKYEHLVNKLCATKQADNIFKTVKELMVLAALIGFQINEFKPLKSKAQTISISLRTYATTEHDSYIYLLALTKEPTLDILKDENLKQAISIFEAYCNAGLSYMDAWILNNSHESIIENSLFKMALEYLTKTEQ